MRVLLTTEMILLLVVAWALIAFVIKDIVLTARRCLFDLSADFALNLRQTTSERLVAFLTVILKTSERRTILLKRLNVIVPLLQIVIWKSLLIAGFAVLYLAIGWQFQVETLSDDKLENFAASLWLSFAVSFRLALYKLSLDNPLILQVANIQFYAGFIFCGFVCFYLIRLKQKAKQLKPRLYKLQYEIDGFCYSPFALADSLREYSRHNLLLILEDWERWATELGINLRLHRQFIYGGIRNERNVDWLVALNIVLDACAALIVSSEGAIEKQARRTFRSARRTLVETFEQIVPKTPEKEDTKKTAFFQTEDLIEDDKVLSAQLICESEETCHNSEQDEMLAVWRFTYEEYLRRLADELEAEIPSIKYDSSIADSTL